MKTLKLYETRDAVGADLETRILSGLEARAASAQSNNKPGLRGYAAVFDSETELYPGISERIARGAFSKDLAASADVRALIGHKTDRVLARTKSGTLSLREDEKGLLMELDLPDTQEARDLLVSVERGDIDQMSFGFRAREEQWEIREGQNDLRTVVDAELLEVSVVAFPAYPDAEVSKRSHTNFLNTQNNLTRRGGGVAIKRRKLALKTKQLAKGK